MTCGYRGCCRLVLLGAVAGLFGCARPAVDRALEGVVFHVAPDGDDDGDGTAERPFASLERARDAVREWRRQAVAPPPGGLRVVLRGGLYPRQTSFQIGAEDSGTAESPVVYMAAPGERVVLSGGASLASVSFVPVRDAAVLGRVICPDARTRLLQCDLRALGIEDYGTLARRGFSLGVPLPPLELYLDGKRQTLARWPNEGVARIGKVVDSGPKPGDDDYQERGGTFHYTFDRPELWTGAGDIWLNGVFSKDWVWSFNRVAEIDPEAKTITFRHGEVSGILNWNQDFFHAENLLEEIDQPGEYYLDRETGLLYLLPPVGFGPETEISVTLLREPLFRLEEASHVEISGFVMELGRDVAARVAGGEGVRFRHCEIRHFGRGGIMLHGTDHAVESCHLHRLGHTPVRLDGGDWETLTPAGNRVENCHIHHWGYWQRVYNPAVSLWGVGQVVRHNLFHNCPHDVIEVRGNDHLIEYNEFHHVVEDFQDMGAIYANLGQSPAQRGTVVRRNFFHHIGRGTKSKQGAVYPDNCTMGWRIEENIFYRIGTAETPDNWAVMNNGGAHIHVANNIFVDCTRPYTLSFLLDAWAKSWVPRYQTGWEETMAKHDFARMPHGTRYPELLKLLEEDRIQPDSNTFARNVAFNPTAPREYDGMFLVRYGPQDRLQAENNWLAGEDPGFVDLAGGDLRLRPDASVFDRVPGFRAIPFERIGLSGPVGPENR